MSIYLLSEKFISIFVHKQVNQYFNFQQTFQFYDETNSLKGFICTAY